MEQREIIKELGKYFVDISKLVFGGVVLSTILKIDNVDKWLVLILGVTATTVFGFAGFYLMKKGK